MQFVEKCNLQKIMLKFVEKCNLQKTVLKFVENGAEICRNSCTNLQKYGKDPAREAREKFWGVFAVLQGKTRKKGPKTVPRIGQIC